MAIAKQFKAMVARRAVDTSPAKAEFSAFGTTLCYGLEAFAAELFQHVGCIQLLSLRIFAMTQDGFPTNADILRSKARRDFVHFVVFKLAEETGRKIVFDAGPA